jgi:hypothetical protein
VDEHAISGVIAVDGEEQLYFSVALPNLTDEEQVGRAMRRAADKLTDRIVNGAEWAVRA